MNIEKYYKELAKNIRVERAKNRISQFQLAEKAEISIETVGQIEREIGNPTLSTIISIALALNVTLNDLIPLEYQ
jgi:transcriptional regulator with XRE-family HTH domain